MNETNVKKPNKGGRPPKYKSEEERKAAQTEQRRANARKYYREHSKEINKKKAEKYKQGRSDYAYKVCSKYAVELGIKTYEDNK